MYLQQRVKKKNTVIRYSVKLYLQNIENIIAIHLIVKMYYCKNVNNTWLYLQYYCILYIIKAITMLNV